MKITQVMCDQCGEKCNAEYWMVWLGFPDKDRTLKELCGQNCIVLLTGQIVQRHEPISLEFLPVNSDQPIEE